MTYLMKKIMNPNLLEAKIIITPTKNNKMTKAIVTLDFGSFKIKGFRIRSNENGSLWVNPPVIPRPYPKKAFVIFYTEDLELWHKLQKKIIDKYENDKIPIIEEEV